MFSSGKVEMDPTFQLRKNMPFKWQILDRYEN